MWVQFLLPVFIVNMAGVVKWLTHQIVALTNVGSNPIATTHSLCGLRLRKGIATVHRQIT